MYSQIRRAIKLSSDEDACQRSIAKIKELFANNGYSMKTIDRALFHCKTSSAPQKRISRQPATRIVLPFIDDQLARKVHAVVRGSGERDLGLSWKNGNTLKHHLVKSALKPPPCPGGARCHACAAGLRGRCHTSGVVYRLTCTLCQKTYIGETGRMVRLRLNEHLRDANNRRQDSPWGDHFREEHPQCQLKPALIAAEILEVCRDERDRKIAESLCIKRFRPALNSNIASWAIM